MSLVTDSFLDDGPFWPVEVWMTRGARLLGENLPGAGDGASDEALEGPDRWSQCKTTVTLPLLSMIFQEGCSSCSSSACIVSHTIFGIELIATEEKVCQLRGIDWRISVRIDN